LGCAAENKLPFGNRLSADVGCHFELPETIILRQLFGPQKDLSFGPHGAEKLHSTDGCEQKCRPRIFRKTRGSGDPRGLRERLGQNNSRDDWIFRKVAGEDWVVVGENSRTFGGLARFAAEQLPNEYERRAMGQLGEVISDM